MSHQAKNNRQPGFTVVELLIVMLILGLMVAMSMSAFNAAVAQSKISRTKVIIAKLDQIISDRWEAYRTRPMPNRAPATGQNVRTSTANRLFVMRDIQRIELPDHISDLCNAAELGDLNSDSDLDAVSSSPTYDIKLRVLGSSTAMAKSYKRKVQSLIANAPPGKQQWSLAHQGAECLYLIVASSRDADKSALDFFTPDEIGNVDDDAIPEILDAWGNPIEFLRWAPGFTTENGALTMQTSNAVNAPDPFDLLKSDSRWVSPGTGTFALKPLVYSPGPDGRYDINSGGPNYLPNPTPYSDPYGGTAPLTGAPYDVDTNGVLEYVDNITNHYQEAE